MSTLVPDCTVVHQKVVATMRPGSRVSTVNAVLLLLCRPYEPCARTTWDHTPTCPFHRESFR